MRRVPYLLTWPSEGRALSKQLVPADCRLGAAATARSAPSRDASGAARQASLPPEPDAGGREE
ncbi:hypothetical protein FRC11_009937, partial [Ceratobasidium sp. 423]